MSERALPLAPAASPTPHRSNLGEAPGTRLFAASIASAALALILGNGDSLVIFSQRHWKEMLLWGAILLVVNLFPIHVAEMTLTLDLPVLLAVAMLYPPEVAAAVALLTSVDVREFSGQVNPTRGTFNRAQIVLSVFLAGMAFQAIAPNLDSWLVALGGTAVALGVFHAANVLFVSCFTVLRAKRPMRSVLRQMIVGDWREFLPTYFGFGSLALVLAFIHVELGGWSVALFVAPLLVARQALVREQRLQRLTQRLSERERLLQRLFDRMADERKDERARIAYDLHDDVLHSLVRVSQLGGFIQKEFEAPQQLSRDLEELVRRSKEAGERLRQVIRGLDLSGVGRAGLVETLSGLAQDLQTRHRTRIEVDFLLTSDLSPSIELCAYQIAKEALENAVSYSEASEIRVLLAEVEGELHISILDNGVGFNVEEVDKTSHLGLGLLEARVRLSGGTLQVVASPGSGTAVEARLPLEKTKPEELIANFSGLD